MEYLFIEDSSGILFVEDEKNDLCSFKAIRKVHEVNHHKRKEQLMTAYRNAGWMSTELVTPSIESAMIVRCAKSSRGQ